MGDYDDLVEPEYITPGWDYICFTDSEELKSDIWQIRKVDIEPSLTNAKMSRKIMMLYHKFLPKYDLMLLVPGWAIIQYNLDNIVAETHMKEKDGMAIPVHPRGREFFKEAKYFIKSGKDPEDIIKKQVDAYLKDGLPNNEQSVASGLIIRRSGRKDVERFCELWWEEFMKYPVRDQLSLAYVIWKYKITNVHFFRFNIFSKHFEKKGQKYHK